MTQDTLGRKLNMDLSTDAKERTAGLRIVVAESNQTYLRRLLQAIEGIGKWIVCSCSEYTELIETLSSGKIDLLILGNVKHGSCFEICRRCRRQWEHLPIVLVTHYAVVPDSYRQWVSEQGFGHVVSSDPVNHESLMWVIQNITGVILAQRQMPYFAIPRPGDAETVPSLPAHMKPDSRLLSIRQGKSLIAIPDLFVSSIHQTILSSLEETTFMTFYDFGFSWGKSFFEKTHKEIELYYETPIPLIGTFELCATIQKIWSAHGLGKIIADLAIAPKGLLLVTVENSGILVKNSFRMEAGFLGGWFSALTHQDLAACAREWDAQTQYTEYLIGGKKQIEEIEQSLNFWNSIPWDSVALDEWEPARIRYPIAV